MSATEWNSSNGPAGGERDRVREPAGDLVEEVHRRGHRVGDRRVQRFPAQLHQSQLASWSGTAPPTGPASARRGRPASAIACASSSVVVRSSPSTPSAPPAARRPQRRPAEQHHAGAERERGEGVGAAADPAVEQHRQRARRPRRPPRAARRGWRRRRRAGGRRGWTPRSPSTPCSTARAASSAVRMPLSTIGRLVCAPQPGQVRPGDGRVERLGGVLGDRGVPRVAVVGQRP